MNNVVVINTLQKFTEHWDFLEEGFAVLTAPKAGGFTTLSRKDYQRLLLCSAIGGDTQGVILMLTSKKGYKLGFVSLLDDSNFLHPNRLEIFCIYSNGKCPSAYEELSFEAQSWARRRGFGELTFNIHRNTGCAREFAKNKLHLDPGPLQFKQKL